MKFKFSNAIGIVVSALASAMMFTATAANASSDCVYYSATATGGQGGFRFTDNPRDFQRIQDGGSIEGRVCGSNVYKIELSKNAKHADVQLRFNKKHYSLGKKDEGDKFDDNWYRKYFTIHVN